MNILHYCPKCGSLLTFFVWAGLSMGWQAAVLSMGAACAACMAMKSEEEDEADEG